MTLYKLKWTINDHKCLCVVATMFVTAAGAAAAAVAATATVAVAAVADTATTILLVIRLPHHPNLL